MWRPWGKINMSSISTDWEKIGMNRVPRMKERAEQKVNAVTDYLQAFFLYKLRSVENTQYLKQENDWFDNIYACRKISLASL